MSWELKQLREVGYVTTGSTPKTSSPEFYDGEVPFVTPADLDTSEPITTTPRTLTEKGAAEARILPGGAVLVSCIGTLGKVGIAGRELATNQQINSIVFDTAKVFPRYGYYACRRLRPVLETMAPATTLPIVSKSKFQALEIPLPPLAEQKRIAAILDAADALRAKRREALAQLDTLLQATFLDLFGDMQTNPKGWPSKCLGEFVNFIGGSQPPKEAFTYEPSEDTVRLIQIRDFKSDRFMTFIPKHLAKRPCNESDVMIARYGPPVFQILRGLKGSYNVALMKAQPVGKVDKDFLYYLLSDPILNAAVVAQSERTAGQSGVNLKFLNAYKAFLPPFELQERFSAIVNSVERQKTIVRAHLAELETLFASLQSRAFRGEL